MAIIPFDDRDGFIWWNGALKPWRDANLHVLSHGLHYGSCVFEGERVYNGKVFKLTEHSARLIESGKVLGFDVPYTVEELDAATMEAVKANNITDGYVRPVAWRGSEMMGVAAQATKINVAIACWPWPSYFSPEARLKGIRLKISPWKRPAPDTAPTKSKAAGLYMICTLSKMAAERNGFADAMMLDWRGYVAEATGANVFFVRDGVLHTPSVEHILDGITRQTVIEIARGKGIEVIVRDIRPEELSTFSECFLTGTAAEVTPVRQIGEHSFTPAALSLGLMEDYGRLVRRLG